jgi:hypothetical protein
MWTLAFGHHEDRTPTHGYAERREAATLTDSGRATLTAILEDAEIGLHRTHEVLAPGNGSVFTLRLPVGVVR